MQHGQLITFEDFEEWNNTGFINGVGYDTRTVFDAIQTRAWYCPVCEEDGAEYKVEHSLDATIEVGNPICPDGHDMELVNTPDEPGDYEEEADA